MLTHGQREALVTFFDELKPIERVGNTKIAGLDEHDRGFQVYIRKAYDQKNVHQTTELNYFSHKHRDAIEDKVIMFLKAL